MSGSVASENHDCVVIGAGPAGLACAVQLARSGLTVLVLEKKTRAGTKLLVTGGGRCNILSREVDADQLWQRFGAWPDSIEFAGGTLPLRPKQVRSLFRSYPPEVLRQYLQDKDGLNIPLTQDGEGMVFPLSQSARAVRDRLLEYGEQYGMHISYGAAVTSIDAVQEGYLVKSAGQPDVRTAALVIACGGASYPLTGSTGDVGPLLSALGTTIQPWVPSLLPLDVVSLGTGSHMVRGATVLPELAGIVIQAFLGLEASPSSASAPAERQKIRVDGEGGTLLFTHTGLSGPAVLALSGRINWLTSQGCTARIVADFLPTNTRDELLDLVEQRRLQTPHAGLAGTFSGLMPQGLVKAIMGICGVDTNQALSRLRKEDRTLVLDCIKACRMEVSVKPDLGKAMQTLGGVRVQDISWPHMELKGRPGLYVIGDAVSLDRPTGGYSLAFCWASALGASKRIIDTARKVRDNCPG